MAVRTERRSDDRRPRCSTTPGVTTAPICSDGDADARRSRRGRGRRAGGVRPARPRRARRDRRRARLAGGRRATAVPRPAQLRAPPARVDGGRRCPRVRARCGATAVRPIPPTGSRSTTRCGWRWRSCSTASRPRSGRPSSCTTCSASRSTRSARSSAARRPRAGSSRAAPAARSATTRSSVAHTRDVDRHDSRLVAERFIAACAGGDIGALMEVLDPDVAATPRWSGAAAGPSRGPAGRRAAAARPVRAADRHDAGPVRARGGRRASSCSPTVGWPRSCASTSMMGSSTTSASFVFPPSR